MFGICKNLLHSFYNFSDEKVRRQILKIFQIWEQRKVYDDDFLADLTGLLSATTGKQSQDVDPNDFQVCYYKKFVTIDFIA